MNIGILAIEDILNLKNNNNIQKKVHLWSLKEEKSINSCWSGVRIFEKGSLRKNKKSKGLRKFPFSLNWSSNSL